MAKLPDPPSTSDLARIPLEDYVVAAGTRLWRVYFRGGAHPTSWSTFRDFGPTANRFDHHTPPARPQERSILYAALGDDSIQTCVAEVFQATRAVDIHRDSPWLVGFDLARPVRLLDIQGAWPTRAGASQALSTGSHRRAREWSRRIYDAYPNVEGLLYRSSMNGGRAAVVFYERCGDALPAHPVFHRALADPVLGRHLEHVSETIGYVVLRTRGL